MEPAPAPAPAPTRKVGVIFNDHALWHKPPSAQWDENPKRISAIKKKLKETGILGRCVVYESCEVESSQVLTVHSQEYLSNIQKIKKSGDLPDDYKDNSVYTSKGSSAAAFSAAGCLVEVCKRVATGELNSAFAIVRPPGHHATHKKAMGFCLLNNVAIAARYLLDEKHGFGIKKILIVDWDVHHGNGTEGVFKSDPSVLYFSVHRFGEFYPDSGPHHEIGVGRGKGFTINVPLNGVGFGDADYEAIWEKLLLPVAQIFQPDIILISAGFDAAVDDPIGKFRVTPSGYSSMLQPLMKFAKGKVVLTLEGGYNLTSSTSLPVCVNACLVTLLDNKVISDAPLSSSNMIEETYGTLRKVYNAVSKYWPGLKIPAPAPAPIKSVRPSAPPPSAGPPQLHQKQPPAIRLRERARRGQATDPHGIAEQVEDISQLEPSPSRLPLPSSSKVPIPSKFHSQPTPGPVSAAPYPPTICPRVYATRRQATDPHIIAERKQPPAIRLRERARRGQATDPHSIAEQKQPPAIRLRERARRGRATDPHGIAEQVSSKGLPLKKKLKIKQWKKKKITFSRSILKLLKHIHPQCSISRVAMAIMNDLIEDVLGKFLDTIHELVRVRRGTTIIVRDIRTATRLIYSGELAKHAVFEGIKAVELAKHAVQEGDKAGKA